MLTAKIVTLGTGTSRVVRMEVASPPALSIDASLYSDPNISISGNMVASGRDMCDVDCGPAGENFTWASRDPADGFGPQMAAGNNCRTVPPLQSAQASCVGSQHPVHRAGQSMGERLQRELQREAAR